MAQLPFRSRYYFFDAIFDENYGGQRNVAQRKAAETTLRRRRHAHRPKPGANVKAPKICFRRKKVAILTQITAIYAEIK
jgi:hypothetical protein